MGKSSIRVENYIRELKIRQSLQIKTLQNHPDPLRSMRKNSQKSKNFLPENKRVRILGKNKNLKFKKYIKRLPIYEKIF